MKRAGRVLLLAACVLTLSQGELEASIVELSGAPDSRVPFSSQAAGMGPEASYFAPSLLVFSPQGFRIGVSVVHTDLEIQLWDRPEGVDITEAIFDARDLPDGHRPLVTDEIPATRGSADPNRTMFYLTIGSVHHIIPEFLSLGFYSMIPTSVFQSQQPFFSDERAQYFDNSLHFDLYEDRLENAHFTLALAGRPLPWLSLGAGVTLSTFGEAQTQVFVSEATHATPPIVAANVRIRAKFVPHASITVRPLEDLFITGTFHWRLTNPLDTHHDQQLWGFEDASGNSVMGYDYKSAFGTVPMRGSLGARYAVRPSSGSLLEFGGRVQWSHWSEYRDRENQVPRAPAWRDTFSPSLFASLSFAGRHSVAVDSVFVPTPVPDQKGRTSFVDNHRLGVNLNYTIRWELKGKTLAAGCYIQGHYLFPRTVAKDPDAAVPVMDEFPDSLDVKSDEYIEDSAGLQTNSPGYPGFESSGWALGGGLSFGLEF